MTLITPTTDGTLEHLRDYLHAKLNEALEGCVKQSNVVEKAVLKNRIYPQTVGSYPYLCLYRDRCEGTNLQICQGAIRYHIHPNSQGENHPGSLIWVAKTVVGLLNTYRYHNPPMQVTQTEKQTAQLEAPFVEVRFHFLDRGQLR